LVASGQFDVGLAADEIDTSGVDHHVFATPRLLCALPIGHRLAEREAIDATDLDGENYIAFSPNRAQ
jgi:DNA-binding transcriptional LysR family regulator